MRSRAVHRPLGVAILGLTLFASFAVACSGADEPTLPPGPPAPVLCNGSTENCQRRYDQVTFAATHNAFSYAAGGPVHYVYPNQDRPITSQLQSGIRGFGIRPCPYYGDDPAEAARVYVTHNFELRGILGTEPLADVLTEVRVFLEANPSEVVTLFAESAVPAAAIATTFAEAGLTPYLYVHDFPRGWPTLAEMNQRNTRLVVLSDIQDPTRPPWLHYLYDLVVDTDYNITDISQFSCDYYRGKPANSLYFINQFIYKALSSTLLLPDPKLALTANDPAFVVARAQKCGTTNHRTPNFIYVDWFGQGDVVGAVKMLNQQPLDTTP